MSRDDIQSRRDFLKTAGMGSAVLALSGMANWQCTPPKKRPNILFLFSDDQRFDTIEALDNPHIHTPHLNRLVKRGITFTRAHIMGGTSGAVCMPSRAMVLTGRTLFHIYNRGASIPEEHVMFPEFLKKEGYTTFGTGKWHNHRSSFARCFSDGGKIMFGGMSDHLKVPVYDFDITGEYAKNNESTADKFSSELFSNEAISFIKNRKSDLPFCLNVSYTAPHDPRMAPKEYQDLYPTETVQLPGNFIPEHPFDNGELGVRDENLASFPRTEEEIKKHISGYYAMITHLDAQIGQILDALEESGISKDTIIVFSGDNGLAVGQHGLLGKQNIYDHSVRVPLIFAGPGIPQDIRSDTLCYLLDIYPTLFELLGFPIPESVEGISLVPAIKNSKKKIRESVFLAYRHLQRGVRTNDNWKLITYNVRGKETTQLFDLNNDPWEKKNLAFDPSSKNQLDRLMARLKAHMNELDDFCDLNKPNWGLPEEKYAVTKVQHLGVGKPVKLLNDATPKYSLNGAEVLVDGFLASTKFNDGYWVGLHGEDLDVVVDLGKTYSLRKISVNFLENQESWIFLPDSF
ncbi:sulfatase-like hydrolase/transferase [Acidobacteriota bacterium]